MTREARIEQTETGAVPADDGWFILNVADIGWERVEGGGTWCSFEAPSSRSPLLGIAHITIGARDGPCAILMVGTRSRESRIHYPVAPAAARQGASVEVATDSPQEAYAGRPPIEPARSPWPLA